MKQLILLLGICLLSGVLSCNKKEETKVSKEFPVWLQLKITELVPEENLYKITSATIIEYNGKRKRFTKFAPDYFSSDSNKWIFPAFFQNITC